MNSHIVPSPGRAATAERRQIDIQGVVQGVGFRPFVHQLAQHHGVSGLVRNTSRGVVVEAEGAAAVLDDFCRALRECAPPLAEISQFGVTRIAVVGDQYFQIRASSEETERSALVPPDLSTCDACVRDLTDPHNRRYGYPFTNCTHCGPRYSIIENVPYDRPATTMAAFDMCESCRREYENPRDRRFHAQPNACPGCGPSLALIRAGEDAAFPIFQPAEPNLLQPTEPHVAVLRTVRRLLHEGNVVAVKGLGGFLLVCDAGNDAAARTLRDRKRRTDKPFALMASGVAAAERLCELSEADKSALLSVARPIVIMPGRKSPPVSPAVAPGNKTLAVMLPYTPLHHMLFGEPGQPPEFDALVMTSGNLSEEPIVSRNEEAEPRLGRIADWFLFHNRDIHMRVDDSVVRTFEGRVGVLRRARGYVPRAVELLVDCKEILACGGELKNTFCLTKGHCAFLSQHIGDLENYESLVFFEETLANLKTLLDIEPQAVAYDLHPRYLSTQFAMKLDGLEKIGVQHHHAHIASCMAENRLRGKVIGVAFDGTGYGTDGTIWGGEFLLADFSHFERRAHFRNVLLAGGDAAVRQPWRAALSYLRDTYGASLPDLPLWEAVPQRTLSITRDALVRRLNAVETSSCGRFFDAVSSILNLRHEVTFEGQAAVDLEMAAIEAESESYPFAVEDTEPMQLDFRSTIEAIVHDLNVGTPSGLIAARFHNTLARAVAETCRRIRKLEGLNRVCLSGGTFQNVLLLKGALQQLRESGFEVFLHSEVPPNDGGIALGQAVVANELLRRS
ncbi:MAG TPA: carbamoyltransferase HypF [Terriglobales bacterium]